VGTARSGNSRQAGAKAQQPLGASRGGRRGSSRRWPRSGHLPGRRADTRARRRSTCVLELRGSLYSIGELRRRIARAPPRGRDPGRSAGRTPRRRGVCCRCTSVSTAVRSGTFREASALDPAGPRDRRARSTTCPCGWRSDQYLGMAFHASRRLPPRPRSTSAGPAEFPRDEAPPPGGFGPTQAGSPGGIPGGSRSAGSRAASPRSANFDEGIEVGREAVRLAEELDRPYTPRVRVPGGSAISTESGAGPRRRPRCSSIGR